MLHTTLAIVSAAVQLAQTLHAGLYEGVGVCLFEVVARVMNRAPSLFHMRVPKTCALIVGALAGTTVNMSTWNKISKYSGQGKKCASVVCDDDPT